MEPDTLAGDGLIYMRRRLGMQPDTLDGLIYGEMGEGHIYLLLAECKFRTASYGPSFFLPLWPKHEARGP